MKGNSPPPLGRWGVWNKIPDFLGFFYLVGGFEKKNIFKNMYIVHLSDRRGNLPHRTDKKNCLSKVHK